GGTLALGHDPEFDKEHQVLTDVGFFSPEEIFQMEHIYPDYMRTELRIAVERVDSAYNTYKIRKK
ncbi:MAG: hypothetical protein RR361_05760, partial [Anaerovorax sp.]